LQRIELLPVLHKRSCFVIYSLKRNGIIVFLQGCRARAWHFARSCSSRL